MTDVRSSGGMPLVLQQLPLALGYTASSWWFLPRVILREALSGVQNDVNIVTHQVVARERCLYQRHQ